MAQHCTQQTSGTEVKIEPPIRPIMGIGERLAKMRPSAVRRHHGSTGGIGSPVRRSGNRNAPRRIAQHRRYHKHTTLLSVGHRPELVAFHSRKIVLERRRDGARLVSDIKLVRKPGRPRLLRGFLRKRGGRRK
jgi:hypothetical protein